MTVVATVGLLSRFFFPPGFDDDACQQRQKKQERHDPPTSSILAIELHRRCHHCHLFFGAFSTFLSLDPLVACLPTDRQNGLLCSLEVACCSGCDCCCLLGQLPSHESPLLEVWERCQTLSITGKGVWCACGSDDKMNERAQGHPSLSLLRHNACMHAIQKLSRKTPNFWVTCT